jgi:perosamine synthetase
MHHYRNDIYTIFGGRKSDYPMMDEMEKKYLLLPLHMGVSVKDVEKISKLVAEFK